MKKKSLSIVLGFTLTVALLIAAGAIYAYWGNQKLNSQNVIHIGDTDIVLDKDDAETETKYFSANLAPSYTTFAPATYADALTAVSDDNGATVADAYITLTRSKETYVRYSVSLDDDGYENHKQLKRLVRVTCFKVNEDGTEGEPTAWVNTPFSDLTPLYSALGGGSERYRLFITAAGGFSADKDFEFDLVLSSAYLTVGNASEYTGYVYGAGIRSKLPDFGTKSDAEFASRTLTPATAEPALSVEAGGTVTPTEPGTYAYSFTTVNNQSDSVDITVLTPEEYMAVVLPLNGKQFESRIDSNESNAVFEFHSGNVGGRTGVYHYTAPSTGTYNGNEIGLDKAYEMQFMAWKNNYKFLAFDVYFADGTTPSSSALQKSIMLSMGERATLNHRVYYTQPGDDANGLPRINKVYAAGDAGKANVVYTGLTDGVWYTVLVETSDISMLDPFSFAGYAGAEFYMSNMRFDTYLDGLLLDALSGIVVNHFVFQIDVTAPVSVMRPGVTLDDPDGQPVTITDGAFTPKKTGEYTLTVPTSGSDKSVTMHVLSEQEYDSRFIVSEQAGRVMRSLTNATYNNREYLSSAPVYGKNGVVRNNVSGAPWSNRFGFRNGALKDKLNEKASRYYKLVFDVCFMSDNDPKGIDLAVWYIGRVTGVNTMFTNFPQYVRVYDAGDVLKNPEGVLSTALANWYTVEIDTKGHGSIDGLVFGYSGLCYLHNFRFEQPLA